MEADISRLRYWRRRAALSQAALGRLVGWPKQKISRLEQRPERCSLQDAVTIAWALGLPAIAVYPMLGSSPPIPPQADAP